MRPSMLPDWEQGTEKLVLVNVEYAMAERTAFCVVVTVDIALEVTAIWFS